MFQANVADAGVGGDAEGVEHAAEAPGARRPLAVRGALRGQPATAVTIPLWAKNCSARSNRWMIDNGASCIRPSMGERYAISPDGQRRWQPTDAGRVRQRMSEPADR